MPSLSNLSVPGTNLVAIVFGIMLAAVALGLLGLLLYLLGTLLYRVVMALIKARVTARPAPDSLDTAGALSAAGLTPAQLAATTQDALRRLADAVTPRDGVTAAWLAFEDGAAALGLGRDPAQTPTEFTIEVLRHSSAPDKDATTLRRLYSRARFSNLPTTRADIAAAETALRHIADTFDAAHIEAGAHR
jgi:hypothetical protein